MTWLFVSTSPDEVRTIPVPAASPPTYARFVVITTTPVPIVRGCGAERRAGDAGHHGHDDDQQQDLESAGA